MPVDLLKNIADERPIGRALLGMDVGKKTIGLALSDPAQKLATPLQTIKRTKFTKDILILDQVIQDYEVGGFVIGLPLNMDGSEGGSAQRSRDFAAEYYWYLQSSSPEFAQQIGRGSCGYPNRSPRGGGDDKEIDPWIAFWDERLSTVSVEASVDQLVEKRKTKAHAKSSGLIDRLAAQLILQGAIDFWSFR